ncbi:MAG: DUF1826 domain-containing protein [Gammaproteobacteria bacterium]|nr:DUF1826 domain-containing protein [Gammaproteobacteria bacterium]MYF11778.1 DUF1826 domain-containing protein [Gammaproteobacteria bacterium]MYH14703.1 DUF1826 domain-containing protein [Gammaproteobacteria bacterium]MYK84786.1 DUF1826 domain-containing protein [Gammaproteobacteria bacterium]
MMRHLLSDQTGDFAAIYDEDVELVSVARPAAAPLEALAEQWSASRQVVQAQWEQAAGDLDAPSAALSMSIDTDRLGALSEEITHASGMLSELLGCERVGIRVTTLRGPMCPRFHADQVPCRMLVTIRGPGTEWIPSDDVNRALLASRHTDAPPIRDGGDIKHLATGNWSLLKGGAWDGQFGGVVHRSPHGAGERLLLSLDPVFTDSQTANTAGC